MTPDALNADYAWQLQLMADARIKHENNRHLRRMARETARRRGAWLPAPTEGHQIVIWADLHFDEDRIRLAANRPWAGVKTMNAELRRRWRDAMTPGTTMVCAGDLGGRRTLTRGWEPPCTGLTGPWHAVLGNHDFTWILWREKALGTDRTSMSLVIATDPPLLVTHVPLMAVPAGCVNVHGHEHDFKQLRQGRWINVSVEQTCYRPLDVRTEVLPLARALADDRIPPGMTTAERVKYTYLVAPR